MCHGGWCFEHVSQRLRDLGHTVHPLTLTGVSECSHLLHGTVNLDTHIQDVVALLEGENLRDTVLVGHSYGGMVITGAADRAPDRIDSAGLPGRRSSRRRRLLLVTGVRPGAEMVSGGGRDGLRVPMTAVLRCPGDAAPDRLGAPATPTRRRPGTSPPPGLRLRRRVGRPVPVHHDLPEAQRGARLDHPCSRQRTQPHA
ncbi:alpha/beta fold hydrolase [Micromonospora sp. NPDC000663]|uniref:alpha/beta fold hydrolase n=1 Tax=Micromonospora sp. NPDC000663 TaxID=3364218 RepID=UPI0036846030